MKLTEQEWKRFQDGADEREAKLVAALEEGRRRVERAFRIPDHIRDMMDNPPVYPQDPENSPYRERSKAYQHKQDEKRRRSIRAINALRRCVFLKPLDVK